MVQTSFQQESLPPGLESGDRLNRYEFERRYNAMHSLQKAELIEGVVYLPAALRFRSHAEPHGNLIGWLWTYKIFTPRVELGDNPTVVGVAGRFSFGRTCKVCRTIGVIAFLELDCTTVKL